MRLYIAYRPVAPTPPPEPTTYEPETEGYLQHADVNILNDGTVYFSSTIWEITGAEIWTALDGFVVQVKTILGLSLGSMTLQNFFKFMYIRVGGSATAHRRNLIDVSTFVGTFSGGWSHDGGGAEPNGSNGYMDTDCDFDNVNFSQNDLGFGFDSKTNTNGLYADFGVLVGANAQVNMYGRFSGNLNTRLGDNGTNSPIATTDSLGLLSINRLISTEYKQYQEGSLLATPSTSSTTLSAPTTNLEIVEGATNNGGSIIQYSPRKRTLFYGGKGMTSTQMADFTTAWRTFETALNR